MRKYKFALDQQTIITKLHELKPVTSLQEKALAETIELIKNLGNDHFCASCTGPLPEHSAYHGQNSLIYCSYACLEMTELTKI